MGLISGVLTNHNNVSHCNSTGCNHNGENVKTLQSKRPFSVPLSESFFRYTKVKTTKPKSRKLSSFQKQRNRSKYIQPKNQFNENETGKMKNELPDDTETLISVVPTEIDQHDFRSQHEQKPGEGKIKENGLYWLNNVF